MRRILDPVLSVDIRDADIRDAGLVSIVLNTYIEACWICDGYITDSARVVFTSRGRAVYFHNYCWLRMMFAGEIQWLSGAQSA